MATSTSVLNIIPSGTKVDISIYQGADFLHCFDAIIDSLTMATPMPFDFTGWTGRAQFRDDSGNLIFDFDVSFTTDGEVIIEASNTLTTTAEYCGWYDVDLISPDATPLVISAFCGVVNVTRQVTLP